MGAKFLLPRVFIGVFATFFIAISTAMPALNWFEFEYALCHVQAILLDKGNIFGVADTRRPGALAKGN